MSGILPSLDPAPQILPLTSVDQALVDGVVSVPLPPKDLEDTCLIHHAGIRQAVYIGTHILDRLCAHPPSTGNHFPPALLFRHILDLGDSIGTLLRLGSASNCAILLRSMFESILALEFILQNNTFHADRSNCYWTCYRIKQLETFTKYDPSTEPGREFHALIEADPVLGKASFPKKNHAADRKLLQEYLANDDSREFWKRYEHAKKKRHARDWYALCSEAKTIRELARLVKMEAHYAILYAQLSEIAHAADVVTNVLKYTPGGGVSIHQVRGPANKINMVASLAANFLLKGNQNLLDTYFPETKDLSGMFAQWYLKYREYFLWCASPKEPQ